jgi:hypothetical protein
MTHMFSSTKARVAVVGALVAALVGASAVSAQAATPEGSAAPMYLFNGMTETSYAEGSTIAWNDTVIALPADGDLEATYTASADAQGVKVFVSPRGQERNIQSWIANGNSGFDSERAVRTPNVSTDQLINGNAASIRTNGGEYSLGLAFVKGNGVQIADGGVIFTHITVTPGTGAYTWSYPSTAAEPDPCVTDPASCQTGEIDLEATTVSASDGALQLSVPAGAKATFGTATLVNGLSTSTAALPAVTVTDERVVTHKGWTLTQSVANFVSGANTIDASNLTVAAKVTSTGTNATAAASQTGGASKPFAEAAEGTQSLGTTTLGADLTLVAPADAPAGTYTSKMTLTLVSK